MKEFVVVGFPLNHSLSPVMHNAALRALGLEDEYHYVDRPMAEEELPYLVHSIRYGVVGGANVTIPYKTSVLRYVSSASKEALTVGSVNTLSLQGTQVVGSNTDIIGFRESLREGDIEPGGMRVTVIGAGGAARAVVYVLVKAGVENLCILNRTLIAAETLAESYSQLTDTHVTAAQLSAKAQTGLESDLIVNCTPVGMSGHSPEETPVPRSFLSKGQVVFDLVYNPLQTRLLREARGLGCRVIDGVSMLVHQGAASLKTWIHQKPPLDVMRNAVLRGLGGKSSE